MKLEELKEQLDKAIKEGEYRPAATEETNILNAEFSLGKYFAILQIIEKMHGIPAMADIREEYRGKEDELTIRANKIYRRVSA